jgi:CDP-6-deoxy-D-xylo-4-hexulose-3-dehydrase
MVEAFEETIAAYVGVPYAVMVNSGSSANLLAIEAMVRPSMGRKGWQRGDEVLVPAVSWPTTVWPVVQLGLTPVFVDSDPDTLALDWHHADTLVNERTVGVMLIHVLGLAADLEQARHWCHLRGLTLIEDCCESFGAYSHGHHVGTVGAIGTYSHYYSHQLTTIEGGTVVTSDPTIADDLRSMRSHGWSRQRADRASWESESPIDPRFLFVSSGYNVRPMELQAAIGLAQLPHLEGILAAKERCAIDLANVLPPWLRLVGDFALQSLDRRHSWMNAPLMLTDDAPTSRDRLVRRLAELGVETRPIIAGNLLQHPVMYRHWPGRAASHGYPVADRVMKHGFMVGCHDEARVDLIAEAVRKVAA